MIKFYKHATTRNGTKGPITYMSYISWIHGKTLSFLLKTNHIKRQALPK